MRDDAGYCSDKQRHCVSRLVWVSLIGRNRDACIAKPTEPFTGSAPIPPAKTKPTHYTLMDALVARDGKTAQEIVHSHVIDPH